MNLSTLERMVGEGDLSRDAFTYLLQCRAECEWLDYKETLALDSEHSLCAFARDVLALKNVGGGYLVVGVQDKTWNQVGLDAPLPYDSKLLRDKVLRGSGVTLDLDIVTHSQVGDAGTRFFHVILVRSSKKRSKRRSPTLVAKDFCASKAFGLRRGEIYARSGDSTVRVTTQAHLEEILQRLEGGADDDALDAGNVASPFAVDEGTYRLLERGYASFVGRLRLRQALLDAVDGDPRVWIINVHGPGGVGKSALVNWATYELYRSRSFEAILQLTAKETILTDSGISRFSRSLYSLENLIDQVLTLFQEPVVGDTATKRELALECLTAWRTLIVLDNMETVSDGRVLTFVRAIPPESRTRVVLTSRQKTGGWEHALPVGELTSEEMLEFVRLKSDEVGVAFPVTPAVIDQVMAASGGLPLAAQWIVGQYRRTGRLDRVLESVQQKESPVLEFSFRNIWTTLSADAKTVLSLMSIFDGPVIVQEMALASELPADRIEGALIELTEVTLATRNTQSSDGRTTFSALPITLSFARHQLADMGELELRARRRLNQYHEQMELQAGEIARFGSEFARYGLESPNEKRAAILCRRGESEMFSGNADTAELLFAEARQLAPQSAYVHAKSAAYELARNRVGLALERIDEACRRSGKKTGALCFTIKARISEVQRNWTGRLEALSKAVEYAPEDMIVRHQFGVALSHMGLESEAITEFSRIIDVEKDHAPPRETLVMSLTTRAINYGRLGRRDEASRDIADARALISKYPNLLAAGRRLDVVEAEMRI